MNHPAHSLHRAFVDAGFPSVLADCVANEDPNRTFFAATRPGRQLLLCDFEGANPVTALRGQSFPQPIDSLIVASHGANRLVAGSIPHRILTGVPAVGEPVRSFVWGYGRVQPLAESTGLLPDAINRALGQPTPQPEHSTRRFWLLVWLSALLAIDDAVDLWELALLHPAVAPEEARAEWDSSGELLAFLRQRHSDHAAVRDWGALRADAIAGNFVFPWLNAASLAEWYDVGSFARAVEAETWAATAAIVGDRSLAHWDLRQLAAHVAGQLEL
ncbi:MAG: hypothetical protein R2706_01135 [Acidimicrobiales bacterium]